MMRSEVNVTPDWKRWLPYLDGMPVRDCRMADEELGCVEVYETEETSRGRMRLRSMETRMLWGKVTLLRSDDPRASGWHKGEPLT